MSTRVSREEWYQLVDVPRALWLNGHSTGMSCDLHPGRGAAAFMQTADHRAIVLCNECRAEVSKTQSQPLEKSNG